MKVILQKDIPKVGRRNDIKEIPDGYARNFMLPKGLAIVATSKAIAEIDKIKSLKQAEKEVEKNLLAKNLKELESVTVTISVSANESGHLFSSVHAKDIAEELLRSHRLSILAESIVLPLPIKTLGEHTIQVVVGTQKAQFKLVVTGKL